MSPEARCNDLALWGAFGDGPDYPAHAFFSRCVGGGGGWGSMSERGREGGREGGKNLCDGRYS